MRLSTFFPLKLLQADEFDFWFYENFTLHRLAMCKQLIGRLNLVSREFKCCSEDDSFSFVSLAFPRILQIENRLKCDGQDAAFECVICLRIDERSVDGDNENKSMK